MQDRGGSLEKKGRKWDASWRAERRERVREVFAWEEKEGRYARLPVTLTCLIDLSHVTASAAVAPHPGYSTCQQTDIFWEQSHHWTSQDPGLDLREMRPDRPCELTRGALGGGRARSSRATWVGRFTGGLITGRRSDQWGSSRRWCAASLTCRPDRMQCQKSLACATFDTVDTTHIMSGRSRDADWRIISQKWAEMSLNLTKPQFYKYMYFFKKSMLIFNRGLSLIPSFRLINSALWWTVLMRKNAENLRPVSPQVVFMRSRWYEESDVVCVCCVGPNDSIISRIFRDIITLLACARSRPAMMRTLSHASDYLTLIVSADKAWAISCFDSHLPDIDYPHCFATFLSFHP